ncbi:15051_t:CDS:2, partial [Racocetra persica]
TLAKEFPQTYVIYDHCLLDWKIKIEEKYFELYGKPFVEIHYDKFNGSQLLFFTLLKILSGQQQQFDIKRTKVIN